MLIQQKLDHFIKKKEDLQNVIYDCKKCNDYFIESNENL